MLCDEMITIEDLFSINFENGYANIKIGEHFNHFQCCKEDEEALLHMMDVLAKSSGLYGTDIVDVECILERCTSHQFLVLSQRKLDSENSVIAESESKAAVLLIIGCKEMGLSDVNRIIEGVVSHYPAESEIIFTAENSEIISAGYYTLYVLE